MTYKTKGIILKRTNLGEADRILTIFTERRGKVKAIAKGVRKTLSHLGGNLELFCLVDFAIAEGRNLDVVCEAQIDKCFINLRGNLEATNIAFYLAEIIETMSAENESHPEIFHLLGDVLEHLDHKQNKLLLSYFEINFLAESGYKPELYECLDCNKKIEPNNNCFSFQEGGIICANCKNGNMPISDQTIKVLRLFLRHQISIISKIKPDDSLVVEISKIAGTYLSFIAQKEFKSKKFLTPLSTR